MMIFYGVRGASFLGSAFEAVEMNAVIRMYIIASHDRIDRIDFTGRDHHAEFN